MGGIGETIPWGRSIGFPGILLCVVPCDDVILVVLVMSHVCWTGLVCLFTRSDVPSIHADVCTHMFVYTYVRLAAVK